MNITTAQMIQALNDELLYVGGVIGVQELYYNEALQAIQDAAVNPTMTRNEKLQNMAKHIESSEYSGNLLVEYRAKYTKLTTAIEALKALQS
jgi:hypothetical protein